MINAWMLIVAFLGIIAIIITAIIRAKSIKKRQAKKAFKPYANTEDIRSLPEYKSAKKKYRLVIASVIVTMIISVLSVTIISSRPVSVTVAKPDYENRDIMLCLDMSGSMDQYIEAILGYFRVLIKGFKGQRLGITIFDGTSFLVSPLTDDYVSLNKVMDDIVRADSVYSLVLAGGSSQIGSGLLGCVNNFDRLGEAERSRSIVLATDNYSYDPKVTLSQAANYAKRYDIAVYGLSTQDKRSQQEVDNLNDGGESEKLEYEVFKEFREAMVNTGGAYFIFSDVSNEDATRRIINQIMAQAASRYEGADALVVKDEPIVPTIIALASIIIFVIMAWRLGL